MQIQAVKSFTSSGDLGDRIADRLAQDLFSGTYRPGDMLPGEVELAKSLSVSRASVRSGLKILAALGIIRRQAGHGTVVEENREWNLLDPRVSRWMAQYADPNSDFIKGILDYRRAVEPYISAMAASHATAQDLALMETAYNTMEKGLRENRIDLFSKADIEFHTAVYRATHNLIWSQSVHILQPAIALIVEKSNYTAEELTDSLQRHHKVIECIRLRQPTEAFDAALSVLERTGADLGVISSAADDELVKLSRAHLADSI